MRCPLLDEEGSMLPMATGLLLVAFSIMALVLELALVGVAYRDVATIADLAAEAGAAQLDASAVYATDLLLDSDAAEAQARHIADQWGSGDETVSVSVDPGRFCVAVGDIYHPRTLAFMGIPAVSISATGCAEPRAG